MAILSLLTKLQHVVEIKFLVQGLFLNTPAADGAGPKDIIWLAQQEVISGGQLTLFVFKTEKTGQIWFLYRNENDEYSVYQVMDFDPEIFNANVNVRPDATRDDPHFTVTLSDINSSDESEPGKTYQYRVITITPCDEEGNELKLIQKISEPGELQLPILELYQTGEQPPATACDIHQELKKDYDYKLHDLAAAIEDMIRSRHLDYSIEVLVSETKEGEYPVVEVNSLFPGPAATANKQISE